MKKGRSHSVFLKVSVATALVLFIASCAVKKPAPEKMDSLQASSTESLTKKLSDRSEAASKRMPIESKRTMDAATEKLRQSKITETAAKEGSFVPDFTLPNAFGSSFRLTDALEKGPVVLVFYRGGWCPYCNLQLHEYQKSLSRIRDLGAMLVAISPEAPENAEQTIKKGELAFEVLSDTNNRVGRSLGLVFGLPEDLKKLYKSFGIDLEASQKNPDWELPVPATYVVGQDRKITWAFVDVDYKKRADTEDILSALRKLKAEKSELVR